MKPSERIRQLKRDIEGHMEGWMHEEGELDVKIQAVVRFLDEEYEKKQFNNQNVIDNL